MLHEGTADCFAQDGSLLPAVELVPGDVGLDLEFEPGFGDELGDGSRESLTQAVRDGRPRGPGLVRCRLGEAPGVMFGVGHAAGSFDIVARPLPRPVESGGLDMDGCLQPADAGLTGAIIGRAPRRGQERNYLVAFEEFVAGMNPNPCSFLGCALIQSSDERRDSFCPESLHDGSLQKRARL